MERDDEDVNTLEHNELCSVETIERYRQEGYRVTILKREGEVYMKSGRNGEYENRVGEGKVYALIVRKPVTSI